MRFQGRTAIVTGGGTGIGREISLGLGREGANVLLAARRREPLEAVAAELRAMGTKPMIAEMSVTDEAAVQATVRQAHETTGRLDILVNNSGTGGPTAPVQDVTSEQWHDTLETNLTGPFYFAKYAAPVMIAQKRGVILNISSIAGRIGYSLRTPYAASKWGLIGLNHTIAAELGRFGVRVNAIVPGPVDNARFHGVVAARAKAEGKTEEEVLRWFEGDMTGGRPVTETEVARAALYLASDDASGITGQALNVDLGFRMQ